MYFRVVFHTAYTVQPDAWLLSVAHQLDENPGRALHHPDDLHILPIKTSVVLPPAEPPDALDLDRPVLAVEGGLLVESFKRHHSTSSRFKAWKTATLPEEPLERPVDPDQRRILTPPVKLAKPFVGAAKRGQRAALVKETDANTGLLIAVDAFLQCGVVEQSLLCQELGEVPMGMGVELAFVGVRNHRRRTS